MQIGNAPHRPGALRSGMPVPARPAEIIQSLEVSVLSMLTACPPSQTPCVLESTTLAPVSLPPGDCGLDIVVPDVGQADAIAAGIHGRLT